MIFLLCLAFMGWANLLAIYRKTRQADRPRFSVSRHILAANGYGVGFLWGIMLPALDASWRPGQPNWGVWGFFFGGLFTIVAFADDLLRAARVKNGAKGLAFGMTVWAVIAGMFMVGTTLNHWWFFRGDKAGIGSAEGIGAKDVACDAVLLVRLGDNDASYRCPTFAVYGPPFDQPFVPWPDYRAGHSVELKAAIEQIERTAIKTDHGGNIEKE